MRRFAPIVASAVLVFGLAALFTPAAAQQNRPKFGGGDALNFAVAKRIAQTFANDLWSGWQRTEPATLMITPRADYFLCPPFVIDEMIDLGHHRSIGCSVRVRQKSYDPQRIEAFTLAGRVPTVVIGSPFSAEPFPLWIGIWLHEHFHQYQMGRTGYREAAEALGLAEEGDRNGQWMVTFPFPYEEADVSEAFSEMSDNLLQLLAKMEHGGTPSADGLKAYRRSRQAFADSVGERASLYAQFVAWQEGVALYTEIRLIDAVAENPTALGELARHVDGIGFERLADRLRRRMKVHLGSAALSQHKRLAFYAWGAAEAFVLDATTDGQWREDYTQSGFKLASPALPGPADGQP